MKDMEIRGAGNLLGRDQSGDVYSVGFDMYVRLLNDAVNRLTQQKDYQEQSEVLMELEYTGFIPDSYIINPQIKMEIYKKIDKDTFIEIEKIMDNVPKGEMDYLTFTQLPSRRNVAMKIDYLKN